MTATERADLARVIRRAALALPLNHPAQQHLSDAHKALLSHQSTNTPHRAA